MISANWCELRDFYNLNKLTCKLFYIKFGTDRYCVWGEFAGRVISCPDLYENSEDELDFDVNYKHLCNVPEANKVRNTTCKQGRRYHSRYVSFDTAQQDDFDNTDYIEQNFGDITYTMKDINGNTTTDNSLCKETYIDFEPVFNYEIAGGILDIPLELAGNDDDAWEAHVIAAPDVSVSNGGSLIFVANPHLKWLRGKQLGVDVSLNPSELTYSATYHTNKIRVVIKHPVGARSNFQVNFKIFK